MGWVCSQCGYYITRNVLSPPCYVVMFLNTKKHWCCSHRSVRMQQTTRRHIPQHLHLSITAVIALYLLQTIEHSLQTVLSVVCFSSDIYIPRSVYNWNFFLAFRINQSTEYYEYIINSINGYVSCVTQFILYSVFFFASSDMAVK